MSFMPCWHKCSWRRDYYNSASIHFLPRSFSSNQSLRPFDARRESLALMVLIGYSIQAVDVSLHPCRPHVTLRSAVKQLLMNGLDFDRMSSFWSIYSGRDEPAQDSSSQFSFISYLSQSPPLSIKRPHSRSSDRVIILGARKPGFLLHELMIATCFSHVRVNIVFLSPCFGNLGNSKMYGKHYAVSVI